MNQPYDVKMKRENIHQTTKSSGGVMALETFGKRLRVSRIDKDLSQIALRDQMETVYGVSIGETYISELERTAYCPTL